MRLMRLLMAIKIFGIVMNNIRTQQIEKYHASVKFISKLSVGIFYFMLICVAQNDTGFDYLCGVKLQQI